MPPPIAAADGSGDQPVGGCCVGDTQQCFGEAEQQHPFAGGQPIFVQEGIDAASLAPPCPSGEHKLLGKLRDLALLHIVASRPLDEVRDKLVFIREQPLAQAGSAR